MNKKIMKLTISGVLFLYGINAYSADLDSAKTLTQMKITGKIVESTCDLDTSGLESLTFRGISPQDFHDSSTFAGEQKISIKVSNCPDSFQSARMTIVPSHQGSSDNIFGLDNVNGSAKGIGVIIYDTDTKKPWPLNVPVQKDMRTGGKTFFNISVSLIQIANVIVPGKISATAMADITYQ